MGRACPNSARPIRPLAHVSLRPLTVSALIPGLEFDQDAGCFGLTHSTAQVGGWPEGRCTLHLSVGEAF